MRVIYPPERFEADNRFTIFLAGSIEMGKARDWQSKICEHLKNYPINILNPRRQDWDGSWEQSKDNVYFREQVAWELQGLSQSDLIVMYLQPATMSPISMLELGLYANTDKLLVCCPDGFWRKGNIDIVCETYNIKTCEEEDLYDSIMNILRKNTSIDTTILEKHSWFMTDNDLLCEAQRIEGNIVYSTVINGSWDISFDLETGGNLPIPKHHILRNMCNIVHIGPLPGRGYNEIIKNFHLLQEEGQKFPHLKNIKIGESWSKKSKVDDTWWEDKIPF